MTMDCPCELLTADPGPDCPITYEMLVTLRDAAVREDPEAQFSLAMALYRLEDWREECVDPSEWEEVWNWGESEEWFQKAANQGHPDAQYCLGECTPDSQEKRSLLMDAAEQGQACAYMALFALEITWGLGEREGTKWYRRARALGHPHDPSRLGIYHRGFDKLLLETYDKAVARVKREAERGRFESQLFMGTLCCKQGNVVEAYGWFAASENSGAECALDEKELRMTRRRLECVLDEKELRRAQISAKEKIARRAG